MNKEAHVNSIAGRMSLRAPQRRSLEILHRVTELAPLRPNADIGEALAAIRAEFPGVRDFDREFPSLCFALATGVGKTRLMGAFISYLYLAHGVKNFFVVAPNLTIYDKLIGDFTQGRPKYVFKGISEFSTTPPTIKHGENYQQQLGDLFPVHINIFNISKINTEMRGGHMPKFRDFREEIGASYFDYLAGLKDLVLIMDESHRYRATAGLRALNDLKPLIGLELTATPFVESPSGPQYFRNIIYDYPLARAIEDGFVKKPAVVTRKNLDASGMTPEAIEDMKLHDGISLHEQTKVELATYAARTGTKPVKPFLLVIARDTTHAAALKARMESADFLGGSYAGRIIQVDSSKSGAEKDEVVQRLLRVEDADEPTEIVIHVNMLKEGWDVRNLYTIIPLRAANARTLIEQSIGRGLRLPFERLTGIEAIDRLTIVAHDRFQEIVDEARNPSSPIRLMQIELSDEETRERTETVIARPRVEALLSPGPNGAFSPVEQPVVDSIRRVIGRLETSPEQAPTVEFLQTPEGQALIAREMEAEQLPLQPELDGIVAQPDLAATIARVTDIVVENTISIPRIQVTPKGEVRTRFERVTLDLKALPTNPPDEALWLKYLSSGDTVTIGIRSTLTREARLEDYVVSGLIDFDDIAYEDHADLLYELADQVVAYLRTRVADDTAIERILRYHQKEIATLVRAQMTIIFDPDIEYEAQVKRGFTTFRGSAYTQPRGEAQLQLTGPVPAASAIGRYVFTGFRRCLYEFQKFANNTERLCAVILDRDSRKWFRPVTEQFRIFYRDRTDQREYIPDFAAEAEDCNYLIETKARNELETDEVTRKAEAARAWCAHASEHAVKNGGKPWRYLLIPHDAIAENMTLSGLAARFGGEA